MNRGWYVAGILTLLIGVAIGWFVLRPLPRPASIDPDPGYLIYDSTTTRTEVKPATPAPGGLPVSAKDVVLDTPTANAVIASPLWVVGRARGTWYFEAEFPIKLYDANDTLLTWASGRAQGEWTTRDFVPFGVTLNFTTPRTDTGTLVLERSNPSGLPEHAAEVRIPVRFR